jgi:hypothetical protein
VITGIGWILLGVIHYFIYKKNNKYTNKIICDGFIIIGIIAIIIGFINLFLRSIDVDNGIIFLLIPLGIYIIHKEKQYIDAEKVMNKLLENEHKE